MRYVRRMVTVPSCMGMQAMNTRDGEIGSKDIETEAKDREVEKVLTTQPQNPAQ